MVSFLEETRDSLEIFDDGGTKFLPVQGGSRVHYWIDKPTIFLTDAPSGSADALPGEEPRQRKASQGDDEFGIYQFDLPVQVFAASSNLRRQWLAVLWRAVLDHIGDEYLAAVQADGRQQLFQEFPSRTDKRPTLPVLLVTWTFPNKHEFGCGWPFSRDGIGGSLIQRAIGAASDLLSDFFQAIHYTLVFPEICWFCPSCYVSWTPWSLR